MASPTLTTPAEIWRTVFACLSPSDLWAVSLTNKDLRILSEPFLYAHIEWTWTVSQAPSIAGFLQRILQRPEIAGLVHELILGGDTFDDYEWHNSKYKSPNLQVCEDVTNQLVEYIESIHVPYTEEWIQELRAGSMDAFAALLISQLPNLKCLHLGKNFTRESRLIGMMLRSALCEDESRNSHISSFAHLQDVSAQCPDLDFYIRRYTDIRNTAGVLSLFYLPSIEQLSLSIDNPTTFTWTGKFPPNPSTLISLDLTMVREGHLGQLLSVTRGLRKLKWYWLYRPDIADNFVTDTIDLDQIARDLSHIQETLTDLTIEAGSCGWPGDLYRPPLHFNGSFNLSALHMLERIKIPLPFVLGFSPSTSNTVHLGEALPKSLEWLTITDDLRFQEEWEWDLDTSHLVGVVRSWLQDWRRFTPRLRGFCLSGEDKRQDWQNEMLDGLEDLALEFGVQIQITGKGYIEVFG